MTKRRNSTQGRSGPAGRAVGMKEALSLAQRLHLGGDLAGAEDVYRQILRSVPDHAVGLHYLGVIAFQQGRLAEAASLVRRALERKADYAEAWSNLSCIFSDMSDSQGALAAADRAVALKEDFAEAHLARGKALHQMRRWEEALAGFRRASELKPDYPEAHCNCGQVFRQQGRTAEAIAAFDKAISLRPEYAYAHTCKGMALLLTGDYLAGWEEYEWRRRCDGARQINCDRPQWDGGELAGRRILLHWEQGFGDVILFARYAPLLAARGGRVLIQCQRQLVRLMRSVAGVEEVIGDGEVPPPFNVHAPIGSLPRAMATTLESIPSDVPYIHPGPAEAARWKQRLTGGGHRVGLAWATDPRSKGYAERSMPAEILKGILTTAGASFYSLQVGKHAGELSGAAGGAIDLADELSDFADTAAAMCQLDLVITVDTAVAHLAGALGRPVWTLLPAPADWRWLADRDDCPWYPTMRLFRQRRGGDWPAVVARVGEALRDRITGTGLGGPGLGQL